MKKLTIIDGNNWARRGLTAGRTVRQLWTDVWENCQTGPVFIVWDGPGATKPRKKIYPDYKKGRAKMGEDLSDAFRYIKQMLALTPATTFDVPNVEADDVIVELASRWPGPVHIRTTDMDLAGLRGVTTEFPGELPCKPRHLRLYKTLVGDKSDNIGGVKGFGQKAWDDLTESDLFTIENAFENKEETDDALARALMQVTPKRVHNWIDGNIPLLRKFYKIVGFMSIPSKSLEDHIANGTPNRPAAESIFDRFLDQDPNRPAELGDGSIKSLARDPLS